MRQAHILTYHSGNIDGNDYASNDLVALAADLECCGVSISPWCRFATWPMP